MDYKELSSEPMSAEFHFEQAKELANLAVAAEDTALANEYVEQSNYHYGLYEQARQAEEEEERTAGMMLVLLAIPLLIWFVVLVA